MGRLEILKHFFPKIHDINATNAIGDTLLMSAARFHDIHTLKLIIDAKPNINLQDKDGRTALMWGKKFFC
jgi:ankyrin repeat protein